MNDDLIQRLREADGAPILASFLGLRKLLREAADALAQQPALSAQPAQEAVAWRACNRKTGVNGSWHDMPVSGGITSWLPAEIEYTYAPAHDDCTDDLTTIIAKHRSTT